LVGIGNVKRRKGLLDESIAVQNQAAELDPLNEDIWVNIGRGYRGLRRFDEARTMFDHARAIAPSDQQVISERAETYLAQGDLATCWKLVEPLKFAPGERGFGFQVVLLVFQKRFDDVEKMVAPVVADPKQAPLFRALSRVTLANLRMVKEGRTAAAPLFLEAETELNQLRAAGDDGILLRDVLLSVEANLGHREQAQTIADSLLETTRSDAWQFPREEETVARAYVVLGDFDRAIPLIEHALKAPAVEAMTPAYLRFDPSWDPIRNDARFQKLAAAK
jgi:tetratricopeptide (TPR) repeat protein